MLFLEISATVLGLLQGFFVMLNKRSNWIFYILQMICLICFSLGNKLFGDVINNSVYLVMGILGFILWNKKTENKITTCPIKEKICYTAVICISTLILGSILSQTADPRPFTDAFTTTSSFTATYYMVRRKIDTWIIWFINDIFYAIQYFLLPHPAYYLMMLNIIWTTMAVASYVNWLRIMKGTAK